MSYKYNKNTNKISALGERGIYTKVHYCVLSQGEISLTARLLLSIYLGLWESCGIVTITNKTISQLLAESERQVQRAKKELTDLGLISITQEKRGRGNLATVQVNEGRVNEFLQREYFPVKKGLGENPLSEGENTPPPPSPGDEPWSRRMTEVIW